MRMCRCRYQTSTMRVLNADRPTNANHDPTTNPEPTLTLSFINIKLTLTLPAWLHRYVQPGFLTRGYGMNAVLLINPFSTRLLCACIRRRPVGWWCGRWYLSRTSNYVSALLLTAICPSIHSSVTLVIHAQIVQHIEMPFARSDRAMLAARFLSGS